MSNIISSVSSTATTCFIIANQALELEEAIGGTTAKDIILNTLKSVGVDVSGGIKLAEFSNPKLENGYYSNPIQLDFRSGNPVKAVGESLVALIKVNLKHFGLPLPEGLTWGYSDLYTSLDFCEEVQLANLKAKENYLKKVVEQRKQDKAYKFAPQGVNLTHPKAFCFGDYTIAQKDGGGHYARINHLWVMLPSFSEGVKTAAPMTGEAANFFAAAIK